MRRASLLSYINRIIITAYAVPVGLESGQQQQQILLGETQFLKKAYVVISRAGCEPTIHLYNRITPERTTTKYGTQCPFAQDPQDTRSGGRGQEGPVRNYFPREPADEGTGGAGEKVVKRARKFQKGLRGGSIRADNNNNKYFSFLRCSFIHGENYMAWVPTVGAL
jgi:hypothetical protein